MKFNWIFVLALFTLLVSCANPEQTAVHTPTIQEGNEPPASTLTSELQVSQHTNNIPTVPSESPATIEATFQNETCPFNKPRNMEIECGFVTVPVDHNNPGEGIIRLAVVIVHDQSENHQPDPVILLTGGPGEKTTHNGGQIAAILAYTHPQRDLIIFDQRGVGNSEPALECPGWVQAQYDVLDESDPDKILVLPFEALMECRQALTSEGHNLSLYNTSQSAADVDAIRQALGYERLNLFGGSYGSFLAQAVGRAYPEMVRSIVINSVWPLEWNFFINAPVTTYAAVERMLASCASDPACNETYPHLKEILFEVIERLNDEPVEIQVSHALNNNKYDVLLSGDRLYSNLVMFLYQTPLIPRLPQTIYDIYNGDYDLVAQLQGLSLAMYEVMSRGMTFSVVCAEDLIGQEPEDLYMSYEMLPDVLWRDVDKEMASKYSIFAICEGWDVQEADPSFKQPLVSDAPTLVLEGELDPVTPTSYAEMVVENLSNSYLFEFPGVGHDVLGATVCSRKMIGEFINEPSQAPKADCVNQLSTGFMIPYEDPLGRYSFPVPPGWEVIPGGEVVKMSSPDGKIVAHILVFDSDNFVESAEVAWALVDPDFDLQPYVRETVCVGCAAAGADQFGLLEYARTEQNQVRLGAAWINNGRTYITLWQTDPATLEERGSLLDTVLMGFKIYALEE